MDKLSDERENSLQLLYIRDDYYYYSCLACVWIGRVCWLRLPDAQRCPEALEPAPQRRRWFVCDVHVMLSPRETLACLSVNMMIVSKY